MSSKLGNWILFVFMLAAVLLLAACGGSAETAADVPVVSVNEATGLPDLGGREITVAIDNAYIPFSYIDPATGEAAGWDYDSVRAICELLNCVPVFQEAAWEGLMQALANGQYDMAADGITITDERKEMVDFSDGYMSVEQRLLVRKGESRFASLEEFTAGAYTVGTQTGTTNYETISALVPSERIQAFEQFAFAVQALIAGDVDAVIMDETAGQGYVGVNAEVLELLPGTLASDQLGYAFPKESDLVEPFNSALVELKANGKLDELARKYFSEAFVAPEG